MRSKWVGRELGDYFVFERIGAGSMAEVYKALQPSMDRTVGIKVLSPAFSHDPQFVARFRREVKIVASLEHPHILPVIDFGECDGTLFLVMRYVNGGTLHDLLERGPLPPATALRYATEIGEALDYAHEHRVVHRDIKPKNVLLDRQGNPFIGDFGLARLMESGGLTRSGLEMIGTPHYMSPEQARGHTVDGRSDLYSLGVMLFQMLTGKVPFEADSTVGVVMKHIGEPVPPLTALVPDLPEALDAVIARAMAKDPAERYQTARDLVTAVAEALGTAVLAGPIVSRRPNPGVRRGLAAWLSALRSLRSSRSGLTLWRKLLLLAHWLRQRLQPGGAPPEPFVVLFNRLFPGRRQQRLLYGGVVLVAVAAFSLASLLNAARLPAAGPPTSTPGAPASATAALLAGLPSSVVTPASASPPAGALAATATAAALAGATGTAAPPTAAATDPAPASQAAPAPVEMVWEKDAMTLVQVPGGEFLLGATDSDEAALEDEKPQVGIYVDGFWIDQTEVTVAQFQEFVLATGYQTDAERGCCEGDYAAPGGLVFSPQPVFVPSASWRLPQGSGAPPAEPRQPVTQVSWTDAAAYCTWTGRRLPTEAEWEKAARGTDARIFPWGDEFDGRRLNYCDRNCPGEWRDVVDDNFTRASTVGVYPAGASPYEALDMAGNVWEWVSDFYDFRGWFRVPTANPPGPESGLTRVLRGGSWLDSADRVRTTARNSNFTDGRNNVTGFRCAISDLP